MREKQTGSTGTELALEVWGGNYCGHKEARMENFKLVALLAPLVAVLLGVAEAHGGGENQRRGPWF